MTWNSNNLVDIFSRIKKKVKNQSLSHNSSHNWVTFPKQYNVHLFLIIPRLQDLFFFLCKVIHPILLYFLTFFKVSGSVILMAQSHSEPPPPASTHNLLNNQTILQPFPVYLGHLVEMTRSRRRQRRRCCRHKSVWLTALCILCQVLLLLGDLYYICKTWAVGRSWERD